MSPEQVKGVTLDARSDLFSFGVILAEMISGRHPFRQPSMGETLSAVLREPPDLSGDIPQGLTALIAPSAGQEPRGSLRVGRRRARRSGAAGRRRPRQPSSQRRAARRRDRRVETAGMGRVGARSGAGGLPGRDVRTLAPGFSRAVARPAVIRSIAVLPLDNYSGDPNQDYFAEGMTDELTANLATISQLRVISRGSAMQFKGKDRPPTPDIADEAQRGRGRGRFGVSIRRQGADHGAIDRRAGGQASLGEELRAQLARRAGAAGGTGVGDRPRGQRATDARASNHG